MESSGARLKKIRLEKGLSLEEAHKKTKVHLNILKAIEEDNLIGLNPVYIKGFLKIYCNFLGVDPKEYIGGYQQPQSPLKIIKPIAETRLSPLSFLKVAAVKLRFSQGIKIKLRNIFIIICVLFLLAALFNLGKTISSKRRMKAAQANKVPAKIPKIPAVATKEQRTQPSIVKKISSSGIMLGIRAKEDCWVHLVVDGKVVFHTVLKKGKFESWQAKDKIGLSLGNAQAVELELDGKVIPALGRRAQAVKNISITKEEGLVVGK